MVKVFSVCFLAFILYLKLMFSVQNYKNTNNKFLIPIFLSFCDVAAMRYFARNLSLFLNREPFVPPYYFPVDCVASLIVPSFGQLILTLKSLRNNICINHTLFLIYKVIL